MPVRPLSPFGVATIRSPGPCQKAKNVKHGNTLSWLLELLAISDWDTLPCWCEVGRDTAFFAPLLITNVWGVTRLS
jgi:hypothetical protein